MRSWVDSLTRTTQDKAACVCFLPWSFSQGPTSCRDVRSTCSFVHNVNAAAGMLQALFMHSDGLSRGRSALGCDLICVATHPLTSALFSIVFVQFEEAHAPGQSCFTVHARGNRKTHSQAYPAPSTALPGLGKATLADSKFRYEIYKTWKRWISSLQCKSCFSLGRGLPKSGFQNGTQFLALP